MCKSAIAGQKPATAPCGQAPSLGLSKVRRSGKYGAFLATRGFFEQVPIFVDETVPCFGFLWCLLKNGKWLNNGKKEKRASSGVFLTIPDRRPM
jgi:hypothetical protein